MISTTQREALARLASAGKPLSRGALGVSYPTVRVLQRKGYIEAAGTCLERSTGWTLFLYAITPTGRKVA